MEKRSDKTASAERRRKAKAIVAELTRLYPEAKTVLRYGSPWELYVAVVLSAQTTDKKVNEVTERLFKKYRTLDDYVHADPSAFDREIRQIGFHRNKTKSILGAAQQVKERFGGRSRGRWKRSEPFPASAARPPM